MERYNKYLVLKNEDIAKHLSDEKQLKLDALITNIRIGRLNDGKQDQQYVVVAADWPMYEDTWKSIEAFVDGKPSELEQLRFELAKKEQQLAAVQAGELGLLDAVTKYIGALDTWDGSGKADRYTKRCEDNLRFALTIPSTEYLAARDCKRDAALLRDVTEELIWEADQEILQRLAEARESGEWKPELEVK